MHPLNLNIYPDRRATAQAVARLWREKAQACATAGERFHVAISGDVKFEQFFRILSEEPFLSDIPRQHTHLYQTDECCVSDIDIESRFPHCANTFFHLRQPAEEQVHRIHGEADPLAESVRYAGEVAASINPADKCDACFDLVLLSIGAGGRIAAVFPGDFNLLRSDALYAVSIDPANGQQHISLTAAGICRAKTLAILVTENDRATFSNICISPGNEALRCPAGIILAHRPEANIYTDFALPLPSFL